MGSVLGRPAASLEKGRAARGSARAKEKVQEDVRVEKELHQYRNGLYVGVAGNLDIWPAAAQIWSGDRQRQYRQDLRSPTQGVEALLQHEEAEAREGTGPGEGS